MNVKTKFVKFYFSIAVFLGILGLIDSVLSSFQTTPDAYVYIMLTLGIIFFFFNIIVLAVFLYINLRKLALVLPIYYLVTYVLFIGIGFWLYIKEINEAWVTTTLVILGIVLSLFEIILSIYVLTHLKVD